MQYQLQLPTTGNINLYHLLRLMYARFLHYYDIIVPCVTGYYGEGNGTPLQYSCLEKPMDRGAWWAAVYGVTHTESATTEAT